MRSSQNLRHGFKFWPNTIKFSGKIPSWLHFQITGDWNQKWLLMTLSDTPELRYSWPSSLSQLVSVWIHVSGDLIRARFYGNKMFSIKMLRPGFTNEIHFDSDCLPGSFEMVKKEPKMTVLATWEAGSNYQLWADSVRKTGH